MNIQKTFAETVATIDVAIVTKQQITFDKFMNESDRLCWLAMDHGDVVPSLFIDMVDSALADLLPDCKGKYVKAYNSAVAYYLHNQAVYLDEEEDSVNAYNLKEEFTRKKFATESTRYFYECIRFLIHEDADIMVHIVSNSSLEACHYTIVYGLLVLWRVKCGDEYFEFVGDRRLSADSILQIINKKPH